MNFTTRKRLAPRGGGDALDTTTRPSARRVLAANLRIIRLLRALSQETLAELAGIDRSYLGGVERAERNLSLDKLEKLAKALDISVLELLREPDPQQLAHQILDSVRRAVDGAPPTER